MDFDEISIEQIRTVDLRLQGRVSEKYLII